MKSFVGAAAIFLIAVSTASAADVGGTYNVEGTNFNGARYTGTASITRTGETTCNIVWNTGGQTSTGICMRYANAFSAAYRLGDRVGLVIYEIKDDGSLVGSWTVAGEEGAGTETLTPTGH
ncbi:MAG: hypothetical protein JOY94_04895 [Methylobacteriaceae bacterium]|nr:hypothetical protein [Methylobacteriaceae bacterium]MBV9633980.1 hypothetical protein [Methylobacteriaceae bacterium]